MKLILRSSFFFTWLNRTFRKLSASIMISMLLSFAYQVSDRGSCRIIPRSPKLAPVPSVRISLAWFFEYPPNKFRLPFRMKINFFDGSPFANNFLSWRICTSFILRIRRWIVYSLKRHVYRLKSAIQVRRFRNSLTTEFVRSLNLSKVVIRYIWASVG
jgi:hypothetical protein